MNEYLDLGAGSLDVRGRGIPPRPLLGEGMARGTPDPTTHQAREGYHSTCLSYSTVKCLI